MTNRIFRSIFAVAACILILGIGCTMGILYGFYGNQLGEELKREAQYLAMSVEEGGTESLNNLPSGGERVTLVQADGTVLFDSDADAAEMENHLDREEIQEALEDGYGEAERNSETLAEKTVYYALRLDDGNVLRVSSTQYTVPAVLGGMLGPVIILLFLLLLFSLFVASRASKKIVKPINELDLDNPKGNDTYDEIAPLLTRINKQQNTIRRQLTDAKRKQEEFTIITENMNEGLLVIDKQTDLLSCNSSALKLLGVSKRPAETSVLTLNRSEPFLRSVERMLAGEHVSEIVEVEGGTRQLIANPVFQDGSVTGGVLLLVDVTEKVQRERLRREFTANVSHELKTPLTSISGFAEIMQDGIVKEEDVKRFAGRIFVEAQRLITLVEDVIKISQLDEGELPYQEEKIDLFELAADIKERLSVAAERRGIDIEVTGGPIVIRSIRQILDEIIYNLCDNAVKYNKENGKVEISVYHEGAKACVTVKDTGIGIPLAHQERVFERFYRVDKSHSKEIGGTGLGLSIVKHGAASLGAELFLESKEGEGSAFTLKWGLSSQT